MFKYKHMMKQQRGFSVFYDAIIPQMQTPRTILEVGIGGGGSHFMWSKNFPEARVVGIDPLLPEVDNNSRKGGASGPMGALQQLAKYKLNMQINIDFLFADGLAEGTVKQLQRSYGEFDLIVFDATDYKHPNFLHVGEMYAPLLSSTGLLVNELPGIRGWKVRADEIKQTPDPQIARWQAQIDQGFVVYDFNEISTHIEQEEEYPGHWRDNNIAVLNNSAYRNLDSSSIEKYIWRA